MRLKVAHIVLNLALAAFAAQAVFSQNTSAHKVYCLAVRGAKLFAGTNGGIFCSTDNGSSWVSSSDGLTQSNFKAIAVSGTNLFAGSDGGGVFLSTDDGVSWKAVNNGLPRNPNVSALAVSGGIVFAGDDSYGVFRSTNNGSSWTVWYSNGLTGKHVDALAVSGSNLFAGTEGEGVFRTTNNGANWNQSSTGLTNTRVLSLVVSGTYLFAGTYGGGVYRSPDNGTSWTAVRSGLSNAYVSTLTVNGMNLFAITNGGVFLSTNSGASWNTASAGLRPTDYVCTIVVSGTYLFAGSLRSGVFVSTDNGKNWKVASNGIWKAGTNVLTNANTKPPATTDPSQLVGIRSDVSRLSNGSNNSISHTPVEDRKPVLNSNESPTKGSGVKNAHTPDLLGPAIMGRLERHFMDMNQASQAMFQMNTTLGTSFNAVKLNVFALSGDDAGLKNYFQQQFQSIPSFNSMQIHAMSRELGLSEEELRAFQTN